ncbi:hypothetical protein GX586_10675 [bacterium]|nr:hypothetical protein [bacterium]
MIKHVRQVHLYSSFALAAFVVMYFATGYVVVHGGWFGRASEAVSHRTVTLDTAALEAARDGAAYAAALQGQLGLRGKRAPAARRTDGTWRVTVTRPGVSFEAVVAADGATAVVTERRQGWQRVMAVFHRLHGYGGGWLYDLWALMLDAVGIAMIGFAVTGVVLWHRCTRVRLPGWIVFACGFILTAATVCRLLCGK